MQPTKQYWSPYFARSPYSPRSQGQLTLFFKNSRSFEEYKVGSPSKDSQQHNIFIQEWILLAILLFIIVFGFVFIL